MSAETPAYYVVRYFAARLWSERTFKTFREAREWMRFLPATRGATKTRLLRVSDGNERTLARWCES